MSIRTDRLAQGLVAALERQRQLEQSKGHLVSWPPPPAPGWAHLPIILIDLIYNLGRNYDSVALPAIARYAGHAVEELPHLGSRHHLLKPYADTRCPDHRPHTLDEAVSLLGPMSTGQRAELFGVGHLVAYRRTAAPKRADTVVILMENVLALGVTTAGELHDSLGANPGRVRQAVQRHTPGVGDAGWAYLPLLVDQESVKRDIHVDRFLVRHLGERLADEEVRQVFDRAAGEVEDRTGRPCTTRGLEHFVWRVQSGRAPLEPR